MKRMYNKSLLPIARKLRNRMTPEEKQLWYEFLRDYPIRFRRQKVLGMYIADFYSSTAKLVIEVDGGYHDAAIETYRDVQRTEFLKQFGICVLRVYNQDIHRNFQGVCQYLEQEINQRIKSLEHLP